MRFDIIPFFNPGETIPWERTIAMFREQAVLAEEAGFTTCWFTEHHFAHNGYLNAPPNPILICADIAARTTSLRVGTSPVVLPDWHPLRVAEDIAMLDNLSGGRVDFGVGKGINERATIQFNVDADRRDNEKSYRLFRECLDIILQAWTEDVFSYNGNFYQFPVPGWKETNRFFQPLDPRYHGPDGDYHAMYVHPRPVQAPHPPVWLMSNAPPTFDYAGTNGLNVVSMAAPFGRIRACWEPYQNARIAAGEHGAKLGEGVGICTSLYVAETMEAAAADVRGAINGYYEFLCGSRPAGEWSRKMYLEEGAELDNEDRELDWFDFLQKHRIIWIGTADYVAERIEEARAAIGFDHLVALQQFPGVAYEKIRASWARLGADVMTRFESGRS